MGGRLCVGSCCFINSRPLQQLFLLTETLIPNPLLVSNILWILLHISPSHGSLHQIPYFKIFFKNGSPMLLLGLNFPIVCFSIYHIFFFTVFIAPHENVIKVHWLCIVLCSAAQSCLTLCDPVDCSPPGSSVQGVLPARILEWVAMTSSRGPSQPRDWTCITCVSCTVVRFFTHWATWEAHTDYTLGLFVKELSMKTDILFYLRKEYRQENKKQTKYFFLKGRNTENWSHICWKTWCQKKVKVIYGLVTTGRGYNS